MADENELLPLADGERILTFAEFNALADVPPEVEWFPQRPGHWPSGRRGQGASLAPAGVAPRCGVNYTGDAPPWASGGTALPSSRYPDTGVSG